MERFVTAVDVISHGKLERNKQVELSGIPEEEQVLVKVLYNGVCKSDIKLYNGEDPFLGDEFSGHEGLGVVLKDTYEFRAGELVSTFWHPGYAFESMWKVSACLRVREVAPQYVLQPLACVYEALFAIDPVKCQGNILVLGTGYFAQVINLMHKYNVCDIGGATNIHFFGHYNRDKLEVIEKTQNKFYDVIIDVSGQYNTMFIQLLKAQGQYVVVANSNIPLTVDTWEASWKNIQILFPSPRSLSFRSSMSAVNSILDKNELFSTSVRNMYTIIRPDDLEVYLKDPRCCTKAIVQYG